MKGVFEPPYKFEKKTIAYLNRFFRHYDDQYSNPKLLSLCLYLSSIEGVYLDLICDYSRIFGSKESIEVAKRIMKKCNFLTIEQSLMFMKLSIIRW
jgi:hypothetical protein